MRWRRTNPIASQEHLLRTVRPEAPDDVVEELMAGITPLPPSRRPRFVALGIATALMLVALAAVGGVSRAALMLEHAGKVATGQTAVFARKIVISVNSFSAANDEYGTTTVAETPPPPPTTTTTTTPTTTVTAEAPPPTQPQTEVATPGTSGSVTVQPTTAEATVSVDWQPTTFATAVTVTVDPTPPEVTNSALVGLGNQVISIVAFDSSGQQIHALAAPLAIRFSKPPAKFVPVTSEDGINFRQLSLLTDKTLPETQQDGYYVDTNGDIVVLTRHLTLFAVLYKANVSVSESGKKTPPSGSGKFGDPTRNHTGPPTVTTPTWIAVDRVGRSWRVPFSFTLDEQAAVYLTIVDSHGTPVWIAQTGTVVRGATYNGRLVHSLHVVILRPGLIKTSMKVPHLTVGETYTVKLRAVDFDGHVVKTSEQFSP